MDDEKIIEGDEQEASGEQLLGETPAAEIPAVEQPPVQPVEQPESETRYQKRIDQLTRARREAEERAIRAEERNRMYEQQRFMPSAPQSAPAKSEEDTVGEMPRDKWEEWHAENPVDAMRYLARAEAKTQAEAKASEVMSNINRANVVQETIGEVFKAHPELREVMEGKKLPEDSEEWQVYDEVAREMPDAKYLVKGPWIVMKEMERRIAERKMAETQRKISDEAAQKENDRQNQVNAGYTAGSSPKPPAANAVKLSPEEERIARKMGMSPEEYAKNKGGK
jgi:hypothetical protein